MKCWGRTAFGPAHPVQIRVTNVNNNLNCRLCEDPRGATDSRRGREDKIRGTHTCDRPRGDVTLIERTTAVQLHRLYLLKWQINWSRGKENTEYIPSPSLSAVTYYLQCPFYYVPEYGSFIAYKAGIRRDLPESYRLRGHDKTDILWEGGQTNVSRIHMTLLVLTGMNMNITGMWRRVVCVTSNGVCSPIPWRWRQKAHRKRWRLCAKLRGDFCQNIAILMGQSCLTEGSQWDDTQIDRQNFETPTQMVQRRNAESLKFLKWDIPVVFSITNGMYTVLQSSTTFIV